MNNTTLYLLPKCIKDNKIQSEHVIDEPVNHNQT